VATDLKSTDKTN